MPVLLIPAGVLVCVMMVAPMGLLLRYSLNQFSPTQLMIAALTGANYLAAVSDPYYRDVLVTTLRVALVCTAITLAAGLPAGYALARLRGRWRGVAMILTIFPLVVGNVVRSAGWTAILGNSGLINGALRAVGVITEPLKLMYTEGAVIAGIVTLVLPYMILTIASVVEGISPSLEEAAANLGARPGASFRRIIVPLALPGVVAGTALVFVLCMNSFATPILLGGARFKMMAPAIYDQFVTTSNWPFGAALAFLLLGVTLALTLAGSALLQRRTR